MSADEPLHERALRGFHTDAWRAHLQAIITAPFAGEGGWPAGDLNTPRDLGARLPRGVPVHLFHGLDDESVPPSHMELYARALPEARVHRLPGRDHQLNNELSEVAAVIRSLDARS